MDIDRALKDLNNYSHRRQYTLSKKSYWFYDLQYVELYNPTPDPPVTIMAGSTEFVTVFILGIIAGIKQNQEDGD